ncbi:hypothetical protein M427DRAFT_300739 [Gonapodya prolifera JEL478]|uniref:Uncharacterized protein n=1 Tax=Gonapodya prolifera (strain JEL478) TaxID=1344416 RepID=A0A139AHC3_GONPJ|nr:hypothetical protein M427DRAFT_300739 [Gonapodya prolifera JEL478]|eukprot:KXS16099.1 hypothetical protein M427DRAFT_300739 [Gonapodya prolifera JEL478]
MVTVNKGTRSQHMAHQNLSGDQRHSPGSRTFFNPRLGFGGDTSRHRAPSAMGPQGLLQRSSSVSAGHSDPSRCSAVLAPWRRTSVVSLLAQWLVSLRSSRWLIVTVVQARPRWSSPWKPGFSEKVIQRFECLLVGRFALRSLATWCAGSHRPHSSRSPAD